MTNETINIISDRNGHRDPKYLADQPPTREELIGTIDDLDRLFRMYKPLQESRSNHHRETMTEAFHDTQLALARQLRQTAELAFIFLRHFDGLKPYTIMNDQGIVETEIYLRHCQVRLFHPNRGEQLMVIQSDDEVNYTRHPIELMAQRTDQWNRLVYSGGFRLTPFPISDGSFLEISRWGPPTSLAKKEDDPLTNQSLLVIGGMSDGFAAIKQVIG